VSSTATPFTCVNGSSQSSRSFLVQIERTREAVRRTALSPPGESVTNHHETSQHQKESHTDVSDIKLGAISPIV
jgi:hypothetical protein